MRARLGLLALLSATILAGCPADNSNNNNNNGGDKDMTVVRDLTGGGGDEDGGTTEDLRRRRDLTDPGDVDMTGGGGDEDMTVVGGDTDMTVIGGDSDMTVIGGDSDMTVIGGDTDMTVVGGNPDLLPGGATDLFNADLSNADMTGPATCGTTPVLNVKSMTIVNATYSANGTNTYKLPLGFTVSGTITLTGGNSIDFDTSSYTVALIDRFNGQTYRTSGTPITVGGDLAVAYSLVVPAGEYTVASRFAFGFDDGASDAQLTVFQQEAAALLVCPAAAVTPVTANITHPAVPTLSPRTITVSGLKAAYNTTAIDPDADTGDRLFYGGLYLESTDGRLTFYKDDSGYVDPADAGRDSVLFANWQLPNVMTTGFDLRPSFAGLLLSTGTVNGWSHTYRFDSNANVAFSAAPGATAFTLPAIPASDIVMISGDITDANDRLFQPWDAFAGQYSYLLHAASCHQNMPSNDPFTRPTNSGEFYSDNLSTVGYQFPVRKNAECGFFAGYRVRLPLATNQPDGLGDINPPAHLSDYDGNDVFFLFSNTTNLTPTGALDLDLTVPNLSGDLVRTVRVQNNAGTAVVGALVQAESASLTDFPLFGGRTEETLTTSPNGEVTLNLLRGTYSITVEAP